MAKIAPLRGLRFNPEKIDRMEDVVTPPYDVIDDNDKAAFLAKNPYNMVKLDLSKKTQATTLTEERYADAKALFDKWQAAKIIIRDQEPAIYLYFIEYKHPSGRVLTRKGFVSLIQLAEFSEGIVKPHEKTFSGVTSDRLRLMDTCQAHFSQIFSLYPDRKNEVMQKLESVRPQEPLCSVIDQDGCRHTIWSVSDPETISRIQDMFASKSVYIADGHHRYTTSLQLRELMRERLGKVEEGSPYNYTMMYFCPMEDPGLSVLPTHRLLHHPAVEGRPVKVDEIIEKLSPYFAVEEMTGGSREVLVSEVLARMDENRGCPAAPGTLFGFYHPGEDRCLLLCLKPDSMDECCGNQPEALRELDVVVLSDLIIERLLGLSQAKCGNENLLDYFSDPDVALDVAVKGINHSDGVMPLLFLMNATEVPQVKRVADESLIMPHKSTYFYPKILTGLLLNKIVPEETIK